MVSLLDHLRVLTSSLREALSRQDWDAICMLDKQCTALVQEVTRQDSWTDHQLHAQIDELSELYRQLQESGRAERERLVAELISLNQSKRASGAYTPQG